MSISKNLSNSCTAVRGVGKDAVLFSYSPEGFSSLALKSNAEWDDLPMGIKVNGAVCVGTPSAFWVIGGNSPSTGDYTGLLKYDYASKQWSNVVNTIQHVQPFKDYTGHGAAYLGGPSAASEVAGSIVLYGGHPGGGASSSTWVIPINNPGQVDAYDGAQAAAFPIIGSWGTADVALVSGNKILLFNPGAAKANSAATWRDIGIVMSAPPAGAVRAAIISGTDNSKTMLKFDLSASPNKLTRVTLQDGSGKPMNPAVDIPVAIDSKSSKRDLTAANWPKYDGQPPSTTRSNPAMAQSLDGQTIVFSGGASDKDPIAMFDAAGNGWVDTAKLFDSQQALQATSTSATSSASTSTSTSSTLSSSTFSTITSSTATTTASSSPTAIFGDGQEPTHTGPSSNAILGITLGTIAAFLAVLGLILFLLRRHKQRQNRNVDYDINPEEKDTVAFAKTMQPAPAHYRGHHPQNSTESYSSVAILMGRMNQTKPATKKRDSFRSSFSSLHKQFKSTISKPIPQSSSNQMMQDDKGVAFASNVAEPRPRNGPVQASDGTRRSSGWNKYWSGGSALQILGYGNKRGTIVSEQSSRYSDSMGGPSMTHANTNANASAGATAHNALAAQRATQDSATVPPLNFEARPGVQRVVSGSPVVSTYMGKLPISEGMAGTIERPISPVSTASGYSSGVPESVNEVWDPTSGKAWGSNRASNQASTQGNGVSKQPQLAMAASSSDMSWLNLGDQRP